MFRSYPPSTSLERVFPQMGAVLRYVPTLPGEAWPTTSRLLTFLVTTRDNVAMDMAKSVGPSLGKAMMKINALNTGLAFAIKAPTKATRWQAGVAQQLKWDVARTDKAPILCETVRVDLSVDGGLSWLPNPLRAQARNTGQASIRFFKACPTKHAQLRVSCNDQLFFAVSKADFEICMYPAADKQGGPPWAVLPLYCSTGRQTCVPIGNHGADGVAGVRADTTSYTNRAPLTCPGVRSGQVHRVMANETPGAMPAPHFDPRRQPSLQLRQ